jgi:hypothetical protein
MMNSLLVESATIYAIIYVLACYAFSKQYPTKVQKVAIWVLVFALTFPGFVIVAVFWSGIISAVSSPSQP